MAAAPGPVPATARGLVVHAAGDVRVEDVPVPRPRPDEAVLEVVYGGICGSDLHYAAHGSAGASVLRDPMLLGHEVVGVVRQPAADGRGPATGTPVAVHPGRPHPELARERYPADRPHLSPAGTYLGSAARRPHTPGAFVRYTPLPADMLRPLPAGLPLRTAALAEPAAVAWHALARAGDVTRRRVLVVGAGPIGALVVAVAHRAGAAEVVCTDLHPEPLERAVRLGATRTLRAGDPALAAVDADVTVESSGTAPGLAAAVGATTRGGRVVLVGLLPPGDSPVPVATVTARELELVGSFRFADEIDPVLAALADGSLVAEPVITHVVGLPDALAALELARDPRRSGKVLLSFAGC